MDVIYIDVLYLINFSMDFVALRLTGAILHLPVKRAPLLLAAALGGGYSVLSALFSGNPLVGAGITLAVACLLCFVAYRGGRHRTLVPAVILFFGISWLLGGMITAFYSLLSDFLQNREELLSFLLDGDGKLAFFFLLALLSVFLLGVGRRHLTFQPQARTVQLRVKQGAEAAVVTAFVDSGNTLVDPLSGRACIVVDPMVASALLPRDILAFYQSKSFDVLKLSAQSRKRVRLIPSDSVAGHHLLVGYLPDSIALLVSEKEERPLDALLALSENGGHDFCGCEALVSPSLIS